MDEHNSWYNGSVWHKDWLHQVYVGHWPLFYGPVILLHILQTIWWRNVVLRIMDQCDTNFDLVKYVWVIDLYFTDFAFYLCHWLKIFLLYIKKWRQSGLFKPLWALALVLQNFKIKVHVPSYMNSILEKYFMRMLNWWAVRFVNIGKN